MCAYAREQHERLCTQAQIQPCNNALCERQFANAYCDPEWRANNGSGKAPKSGFESQMQVHTLLQILRLLLPLYFYALLCLTEFLIQYPWRWSSLKHAGNVWIIGEFHGGHYLHNTTVIGQFRHHAAKVDGAYRIMQRIHIGHICSNMQRDVEPQQPKKLIAQCKKLLHALTKFLIIQLFRKYALMRLLERDGGDGGGERQRL